MHKGLYDCCNIIKDIQARLMAFKLGLYLNHNRLGTKREYKEIKEHRLAALHDTSVLIWVHCGWKNGLRSLLSIPQIWKVKVIQRKMKCKGF